MGYCADTSDSHFLIAAVDIPAALAAVNTLIAARPKTFPPPRELFAPAGVYTEAYRQAVDAVPRPPYRSLTDAIETLTNFEDCEESEDGFFLGWHHEKWYSTEVEAILAVLAPHAETGSYVRLCGEDGSLWGYQVIVTDDGQKILALETGRYEWAVDHYGSGVPVTISAAAELRPDDEPDQAGV